MPRLLYIFPTAYMSYFFQRGQNQFLKRHGYEIHIATTKDRFLDEVVRRDDIIPHPITIKRYPSPLSDLLSMVKLIKLIYTIEPDIIHVGTPKGALLGMLAALPFRKPVKFFACHGSVSAREEGSRKLFHRTCEAITIRIADQVWCVSNSLLDYFVSTGILPKNKGIVLGNGTANGIKREWIYQENTSLPAVIKNLQNEKKKKKFPIIGFVGRLNTLKGVDLIAEAWLNLHTINPDVRLLLIGELDSVHQLSQRHKNILLNDPRITLPGFIDSGAIGFCYDLMDIFVLPSRGEGFVTVSLEASLTGLPVITTDVIGCVDAIKDGVTGTIIPSNSITALVDAILNYLEHPNLAINHGIAGQKYVKNSFNTELLWDGMVIEYQKLLQQKRGNS